jgi:hypothetical protein
MLYFLYLFSPYNMSQFHEIMIHLKNNNIYHLNLTHYWEINFLIFFFLKYSTFYVNCLSPRAQRIKIFSKIIFFFYAIKEKG